MVTEAQKKAKEKYYKTNIKRIPLEVQMYEYDAIKNAADATGKKVNQFIKDCVWSAIGKPEREVKED